MNTVLMLAGCFVLQNTIDDGHTQPTDLKHRASRGVSWNSWAGNISYNRDNEGVTLWGAGSDSREVIKE